MRDPALTARHLVGRDDELAAIVRLFDAPEQLPGVAVLPGEAGIGKTTLWLAGIDAAAARGYRILSCRPSEAETGFAFAGLADLLSDVAGDVLPELPPIQRRALDAALLLGESEIHADDRAVAAAFLGVLRLLACNRPLCLAVDDIQWLDEASVAALRYALARLERELAQRGAELRGHHFLPLTRVVTRFTPRSPRKPRRDDVRPAPAGLEQVAVRDMLLRGRAQPGQDVAN